MHYDIDKTRSRGLRLLIRAYVIMCFYTDTNLEARRMNDDGGDWYCFVTRSEDMHEIVDPRHRLVHSTFACRVNGCSPYSVHVSVTSAVLAVGLQLLSDV